MQTPGLNGYYSVISAKIKPSLGCSHLANSFQWQTSLQATVLDLSELKTAWEYWKKGLWCTASIPCFVYAKRSFLTQLFTADICSYVVLKEAELYFALQVFSSLPEPKNFFFFYTKMAWRLWNIEIVLPKFLRCHWQYTLLWMATFNFMIWKTWSSVDTKVFSAPYYMKTLPKNHRAYNNSL